jgi:hypothetical protein
LLRTAILPELKSFRLALLALQIPGKRYSYCSLVVRDALKLSLAKEEYNQVVRMCSAIFTAQVHFLQLDKKLKKTKNRSYHFDLTSATTSLTGTDHSAIYKTSCKILPSVGLAMVPIKEASAPNKA